MFLIFSCINERTTKSNTHRRHYYSKIFPDSTSSKKKRPIQSFFSIPGGFVNEGERVEDAAKREAKEETSLDIELIDILGVYSEPNRDPRGHNMSTVFIGEISSNNKEALAQDDAAEIKWTNLEELDNTSFAFDHKKIILDYKKWKKSAGTFWSSRPAATLI